MSEGERRLAAVMFTDMVGFTALTQSNEPLAMELLSKHASLLRTIFPRFRGREVKLVGDSFIVEFDSALDAIRCAVAVQSTLHAQSGSSRTGPKIQLRIGIHLGDVIHKTADIFGDAVNMASRIEPIAKPEGICVTRQVFDEVRNKIPEQLVSMGPRTLKNVQYPVTTYRVVMPWEESGSHPPNGGFPTRIAVLPFVNISPDPADEYFADGLTEELIGRLSQVKGVEVIARTSVMTFKKQTKKVSEISKELAVGNIIEGSVRKSGDRVRVAVQLVNGETESHLWASNYDRDLTDIFAIQTDIASKVAESLPSLVAPSPSEVERETPDTATYTQFLRGRELLREGSEQSIRQAIGLFSKAVQEDPHYAKAHSGLAACYIRMGNMGYGPYQESIDRAKEPLKRALESNPGLAEAHAALSWILFNEEDNQGSEVEARTAIELSPSLAEGYDALANVLTLRGNADEALKLYETCYRLDPLRSRYIVQLGRAYFYAGMEREALEHWEKTSALSPAGTYRIMTEYYLSKGDSEKAKELFSKAQELEPSSQWLTWMAGFMAARAGDKNGALAAIRRIEESKTSDIGLNYIGFIRLALGDLHAYFDNLNRAVDKHALMAVYPMYSPLLADGRKDPRYSALMKRIWSQPGPS